MCWFQYGDNLFSVVPKLNVEMIQAIDSVLLQNCFLSTIRMHIIQKYILDVFCSIININTFILKNYSVHIDTITREVSILYFKGMWVKMSLKWLFCLLFYLF